MIMSGDMLEIRTDNSTLEVFMQVAILFAILVVIYIAKALLIAWQHDEIIADDAMICWEPIGRKTSSRS